MFHYRQVQFGLASLVAFVPVAVGGVLMAALGLTAPGIVLSVASVLLVLLFGWMRVDVVPGIVRLRFGLGLIRKTVAAADIEQIGIGTDPWYYGWGIRLTPYGVLYRVSGTDTVHLRLRSGRIVGIGSPRPQALAEAIDAARRSPT
jgi:hypothetical protein